jgi:hypothetical protein
VSLLAGDIVIASGFPCAALCLDSQELAWNDASGVVTGSFDAFAQGRSVEVLRLPDPLRRRLGGAFPPSLDPRHTSIPERELVAYLTAGQPVDRAEAIPFVLKSARTQIGHDFLTDDATDTQRETASVVFILNSWLVAECCHGVTIHSALSLADLRGGHFEHIKI